MRWHWIIISPTDSRFERMHWASESTSFVSMLSDLLSKFGKHRDQTNDHPENTAAMVEVFRDGLKAAVTAPQLLDVIGRLHTSGARLCMLSRVADYSPQRSGVRPGHGGTTIAPPPDGWNHGYDYQNFRSMPALIQFEIRRHPMGKMVELVHGYDIDSEHKGLRRHCLFAGYNEKEAFIMYEGNGDALPA